MFCPDCGSLMFRDGPNFKCSRCTYEKSSEANSQSFVTRGHDKETAVINDENAPATRPKTRMECPECKHSEAFFTLRQTRAADEPETRIYRCCKCSSTWREY